jgi:hypothetical protein
LRIAASLKRRSFFQFVPEARLAFDVFPIGGSFVRFCPPRRDDTSFVILFIGVNHRYFQATDKASRIDTCLAIAETVIQAFKRRLVENPLRILEGDAVPGEVCYGSFLLPSYIASAYLHNVHMIAAREQQIQLKAAIRNGRYYEYKKKGYLKLPDKAA